MLVICYQQISSTFAPNDTAASCYTTTDLSLNDWKNQNPNTKVDMVFDQTDELSTKQLSQKEKFDLHCHYLGFDSDDYLAEIYDNHNHKCLFVGFLPRNTKYKCRLYDTETQQYYKVSPKYIKCRMEKYKEQ